MADTSFRVIALFGAFTGNENTDVYVGLVMSGSQGTPSAFKNCVKGSLLSARTVRM